MTAVALTREAALKILRPIGESGVPPEEGIDEINTGNESYLKVIDEEYLHDLLQTARGSSFKLVCGTYGAGKTHFLYCVQSRAWRRGFLTALVTLTPRKGECPFDSRLAVYRAVATRLRLPSAPGRNPVTGFTQVLRHVARERATEDGADSVRRWARTELVRAPIEKHPFRQALVRFVDAALGGSPSEEGLLEGWLLGEDVPLAQARALGIFEVPREDTAFGMLRSLVQTVVVLGFPGTVLLFDEAEKQLSIDHGRGRSTAAVVNHLRETVDLCGRSELPATLFLYAVTPEFTRTVLPEYPALQQRLGRPLEGMSVANPRASLIDLELLDLAPDRLLTSIGERLAAIYAVAYDWRSTDPTALSTSLDRLVKVVVDTALEVAHRRLFVKTWVRTLDGQRLAGDAPLTIARAEQLVRDEFKLLTAPAIFPDEGGGEMGMGIGGESELWDGDKLIKRTH